MAWGSDTAAIQLTGITTEQVFDQVPTLNPRATAHVQASVDFPSSPTDHAIVAVYSTLDQIEPVGLMWGDHPGALSNADLRETLRTNDDASEYQHLGCLERLNGPVDDPAASRMSCHALSRFPAPQPDNFPMAFPVCGSTSVGDDGGTAVSALYFRNLSGDQIIDDVDDVELPEGIELPKVSNLARIEPLDYSLQLSFSMINFCNFWKDQDYTQSIEVLRATVR